MKDERILRKIRACLNMAADTGSPEEAAIAAGQARALMDKHQVSEMDLKTTKDEDFGSSMQMDFGTWSGMLAVAMSWLNDVNCRRDTESGMPIIKFEGYLVDAVTAKELYLYLCAQAEIQAKRVRGKKDPFKQGFAAGVQRQVKDILKEREKLTMSDGTSLVVSKRAMVEQKFGQMQTSKARTQSNSANYQRGFEAGSKVSLNRQVSGTQQARIK